MKLILIGMKNCGKTTIGNLLAKKLNIDFFDLDIELEKVFKKKTGKKSTFQEIFKQKGEIFFRSIETQTLKHLDNIFYSREFILACGGGTLTTQENLKILINMGLIIYLDVDKKINRKRIKDTRWLNKFNKLYDERKKVFIQAANLTIGIRDERPEDIVTRIIAQI